MPFAICRLRRNAWRCFASAAAVALSDAAHTTVIGLAGIGCHFGNGFGTGFEFLASERTFGVCENGGQKGQVAIIGCLYNRPFRGKLAVSFTTANKQTDGHQEIRTLFLALVQLRRTARRHGRQSVQGLPHNFWLENRVTNMPKAKTANDYRELAQHVGWTWLGLVPKNTGATTEWLCPRGHLRSASYDNLKQGMGCRRCQSDAKSLRRKHRPGDYHVLANARGFTWLGPEVKGALEKTAWECADGHRWSARYNDIQQGSGCPRCGKRSAAEKTRRQPGEYHLLAAERGLVWTGRVVNMNKAKTSWKCSAGHTVFASFNQITKGKCCKKCSGLEPKTAQDYLTLAASRGFTWTEKKAANTSAPTSWQCAYGHKWRAPYDTIRDGHGCPYCANRVRKVAEQYRLLAEQTGLVWLGPVPKNSKSSTSWLCPKGHRIEKSFNSVQRGSGYAICSGQEPKKPSDYHSLAETRGFEWVGPEVKNTSTDTWWMCTRGHRWRAKYGTIYMKHGCPECLDMVNGKRVSKAQRQVCEMVDGGLNAPAGRYLIDVVKIVGDIKIAIEYDSWCFHGAKEESDLVKTHNLLGSGWRVLRIRANALLPSKNQLDAAIERLVTGERWIDIELSDWGKGPVAWFYKSDEKKEALHFGMAGPEFFS